MFRSETDYSSPQLEVVGAERCVRQLTEQRGLHLKEFVSDQHMGVRKRVSKYNIVDCRFYSWINQKVLVSFVLSSNIQATGDLFKLD